VEREHTEACTIAALEVGINFFDTSNVYGSGAAESVWGEILKNFRREEFILATKLFFPMDESSGGLSREQVHKQIDGSLERLGMDHVDLYQCHRYDEETPLEETMAALTAVVRAGKARYLGFSEWPTERIREALEMPGVEKFVSSQPQYSILWREPEREVFALCAANGISQIVWSPLAQGTLTGKYKPGEPPPAGTRAGSQDMGWAMDRFRDDEVLVAVQRLQPIADGLGITMAQLALAWVLRRPEVASAIIGASRPEQVEDNAAGSGIELDDDTLRAIDEAVSPVVPV
jgi:aryl-alcohol dehydrogenase-like predicted oxidoreductase